MAVKTATKCATAWRPNRRFAHNIVLTLKCVKSNVTGIGAESWEAARKEDSDMTPEPTTLAQNSFAQVASLAETAARPFYDRLLELNPSPRGLFRQDLREPRMKLTAMLTSAVNNLRQWSVAAPHVKQLGLLHITPLDCGTVRTALIDTLERV